MPIGSPNKNTIRVERYQQKAGYISKSYKLKREIVEKFAEACDHSGVSQAAQLTSMMESYVRREHDSTIMVIRNGDRFLVYRDPEWGYYMFPHDGGVPDHWSESKHATKYGEERIYNYRIFSLSDCVWMSAKELLADEPTREHNSDLIQHILELRIQ